MKCDQYDRCLNKAAYENWDHFNCEACSYENRGKVDFLPSCFICAEQDLKETFGAYWEFMDIGNPKSETA